MRRFIVPWAASVAVGQAVFWWWAGPLPLWQRWVWVAVAAFVTGAAVELLVSAWRDLRPWLRRPVCLPGLRCRHPECRGCTEDGARRADPRPATPCAAFTDDGPTRRCSRCGWWVSAHVAHAVVPVPGVPFGAVLHGAGGDVDGSPFREGGHLPAGRMYIVGSDLPQQQA